MKKKKIIILGGNPETGELVKIANSMDIFTIVLDPYENSPSKRFASKSYEIDVTDLAAVDKIIQSEDVDGVLVGVADPIVSTYFNICKRNNFYCYANQDAIKYLTSKSLFAQLCSSFNIETTPVLTVDFNNSDSINSLSFPVVVKPVDSGAGVGISVCSNLDDLKIGITKGKFFSKSKSILIEKFMQCDDMFVYYTFINGKIYLSATADRYKTNKQGNFSAVCIGAEYPSRHTNKYINSVHTKLIKLLQSLKISNGVLCIQFFFDTENFYAYDPGFRLQGEGPHLYLDYFNKFDHRKMLLNYSLNGSMFDEDFDNYNDFLFHGNFATTIWILLKPGTISIISGVDVIKSHPNVIFFLQRFQHSDTINFDMIGTERQVFARIYTVSKSEVESKNTIDFIHSNLIITSSTNENMIVDSYAK